MTVDEGAETATFTVNRSGSTSVETIYFSTQTDGCRNCDDYTGLGDQAPSFAGGQTSKTVTVSITNAGLTHFA